MKEIHAGYLSSPYFRDLYLYLAQNKLPSAKMAICKVEMLAEKIHLARFIVIQIGYYTREGNSIIGNT